MIALNGIQLHYKKPVLKDLHLQVKRGEILGLVGKSGAGKSSLLKICAGLQDPDAGIIHIDGKLQSQVCNLLVPGFASVATVGAGLAAAVAATAVGGTDFAGSVVSIPAFFLARF